MYILGIESSCDETAAAIVEDGKHLISNVISTSVKEQALYGGVVPEIASRRHAEYISATVQQALQDANMAIADVDAVAVIGVNGAPSGSWAARWSGEVKAVCALVALAGMGCAVWWRLRNPLATTGRRRARPRTEETTDLGERILRLMTDEAVYTQTNLKVADLARRLGEAEYKVSRSIADLGFRNFNQMANRFRIEEARRRLADPALRRLPILTIAYDCGFGSIGPFNRAFKAETGLTPLAFRGRAGP